MPIGRGGRGGWKNIEESDTGLPGASRLWRLESAGGMLGVWRGGTQVAGSRQCSMMARPASRLI